MNYFLTSYFNANPSAIEIAEIRRLKLFDQIGAPAKIVTTASVWNDKQILTQLGIQHRVVNLYRFYQQLDRYDGPKSSPETIRGTQTDLPCENDVVLDHGKPVIKIHATNGQLAYVDYLDLFGFTNRRDFYESGVHSYSEFYDDKARLQLKQYYNYQGIPVINCYYHGGANNQPILTMIQLTTDQQTFQFQSLDAFRAHFLDDLVNADDTLFCDRENYWGKAMGLMQKNPRRMLVIHAAFTTNAKPDGEVFPSIKTTIEHGKLTDIITSTQTEANHIHARFPDTPIHAIPVSAVPDERLVTPFPFEARKPFQIISVARVTEIKQLDHAIRAVMKLHACFPQLDLKIYGYEDSQNDYAEPKRLKQLVFQNQAASYIHFMGYTQDLSNVYQTADLLLLTSRSEGFSMAVLEALSYACPVVSYDIHYGPNEMVRSGENGELVSANDEDALFKTLADIFNNRQRLQAYSLFAQKSVAAYSASALKRRWQRLLRN